MNKRKSNIPPKWINALLRRLCKDDLLEEIEGDLLEYYELWVVEYGRKKANRLYIWHAIKFFRPYALKKSKSTHSNHIAMIKHNFILAFRNFQKYKGSFFINLLGLSSGLACVLLIYLWVNDELNVDKFHEKDARLFQVMGNYKQSEGVTTWNGTSASLSNALTESIPEVEYAISSTDPSWAISFSLISGDNKLKSVGKFVDNAYFNMFSYDLIQGDRMTALLDINAIVISESLAMRLFNTTDQVVGKTIEWQDVNTKSTASISGIFRDPPINSTDQFDFLLPFELYSNRFGTDWNNPNCVTYVLLKENVNAEEVNEKVGGFMDDHIEVSTVQLFLQQFSNNYLYGRYENGVLSGGRIEYVRLFSIIALFILAIACINFMNLSTARSARRVKEVGIKKVVGANRGSLIAQYMGESMLMAFISLLVALSAVIAFLPQFNQITNKHIDFQFDPTLLWVTLGITILTGLISGSYPALYMSGFRPGIILKSKLSGSKGELWVRKGLVVFQFTLSIVLMVSVIVVYQQMEYVQSKNIGYDRDNVILFDNGGRVAENIDSFLEEARNLPGILNASAITNDIFSPPGGELEWEGNKSISLSRFIVHYGLIETLGLEVKEGTSLLKEFANETQILLNESAVDAMGLEAPVGKKVKFYGQDVRIVGVVRDFHFRSFHENVGPMLFQTTPVQYLNTLVMRLKAGSERETLSRLEGLYEEFNPGYTLEYKFLNQHFQALYESENKVAALSKYFGGIAILISCLGLFGLVAYTAESRTKEIGIRKILGSSVFGILSMLSEDFTKIVITALVVGLPISYFIAEQWLDGFAYRVNLEWWFFATSGLLTLSIAWLIVLWQTMKVAHINPTECLRDE